MKNKAIIFILSVLLVAGIVYAQQPGGQGQYTRENFPTATSSAAKVISLDLKENITNTLGSDVEVEVLKNVVYVDRNGTNLHVHILYPKGVSGVLPCIVYVPGSAWMKQNIDMGIPNMTRLAANGFVVAIVEYRPSIIGKFPSQVQDAKTAIRFMRKNAGQYHVDINNIFIWGDSSGGHTALFVGFTQGNQELDTDAYSDYSDKVNAVVNYFGPSELAKMADYPSMMNHSLANAPEGLLIGGAVPENPEAARKASPVYYATSQALPVFMAHGDRDILVPLNQSDLVAEALDKVGVHYEYYCLLGAGHGGREFWSDEILVKVLAFLKQYTVKSNN